MTRLLQLMLMAGSALGISAPIYASQHGPLFGLATPTNAKDGWSLDLGTMDRVGVQDIGSMARAMLSYGITEDLQVSLSAPVVFSSAPLPPVRITSMMPTSPDFEGLLAWRFQRRAPSVGTRFETTVYGGLLVPGPQRTAGMLGMLRRAPGAYTAIVTGVASRRSYLWAGISNTHSAEREGDQRPNIFSYTAVYGYRPPAGRKEYPHLDWRFFGEMTGEKSNKVREAGMVMPGTGGNQVFFGPSALIIYKSHAIAAGVQFPVFRNVGATFERERLRFAVDFSHFF